MISISCDYLSCPSFLGVKEHEIGGRLQRGENEGSSKEGRSPIEEVEGKKSPNDDWKYGVIAMLRTIAPETNHKAAAMSDLVVVYQAGFQLSPYF